MEQKQAIRLFHTVCGHYGISADQKQAIYSSYGVDSSTNMSANELQQAVNSISEEAQLWRVRVMGAIGGYLNRNKIESNQAMIKAIACRAAKATDFNKLTVKELRTIYNTFLKKQNGIDVQTRNLRVSTSEITNNNINNDNNGN